MYKKKSKLVDEVEKEILNAPQEQSITGDSAPSNGSEEVVVSAEEQFLKRDTDHVDDDYKIHVIKDYDGKVDDFYLSKKDPKYDYRWLADNQQNLSRRTGNMLFQGEGWQLCEREHLKRIGVEEKFISPDGFYRRGDLVLAFIPKDLSREKVLHKAKKSKEQLSQIDRLLKDGDSGSLFGAGGIHETMKGIQTQKQLGIK